jgi:hypothetical protein
LTRQRGCLRRIDFLCLLDDIATTIDSLDIVFGKIER